MFSRSILLPIFAAHIFGSSLFAFQESDTIEIKEATPTAGAIVVDNALLKLHQSSWITSEVPGLIQKMNAKEGITVKKGDLLFKIRDEAAQLSVNKFKTQLEIAKKKSTNMVDLEFAKKGSAVAENEFRRAEQANKRAEGAYPLNEIDRLRLVYEKSLLEIERSQLAIDLLVASVDLAESEYRQAVYSLRQHTIAAPSEGIVVSVDKHVGEWIEPGTPIVQIIDTSRLRIEGFIPNSVATNELIGCKAEVVVMQGENQVATSGEVVFVHPDSNPLDNTVRVHIEIDNSEGQFRAGRKVTAKILQADKS